MFAGSSYGLETLLPLKRLWWHTLCLPRAVGGWNVRDMTVWNKAAVAKLLWAITFKKEKMWSRWMDSYYIKGRSLRNFHCPNSMSWAVNKIVESYELVEEAGGWNAVTNAGVFSINKIIS